MEVCIVTLARRILLELWAVLVLSGVLAFLGPFGTYLMGDYLSRFWNWWALMMGAYTTLRPLILLLNRLAEKTRLPTSALVFWGLLLASFPLALLWQVTSKEHTKLLGGYSGLLSFTLLCAATVAAIAWWARKADTFLIEHTTSDFASDACPTEDAKILPTAIKSLPRLHSRLGSGFQGEILALQSEDHYVRVHGAEQSELLLMRLRDAIAEMDDCPGVQTHRSWWVAYDHVTGANLDHPKPTLTMKNGLRVPIARSSIDSVKQSLATEARHGLCSLQSA